MFVYCVFASGTMGIESELIATYSTRKRAQALIDAQESAVQRGLRIEVIDVDKDPEECFWQRTLERMVWIEALVIEVEQIVAESGRREGFDARRWVLDWLLRPHPAFAGRCPESLLDTDEHRKILHDLLARMQSGAYS